MIKTREWQKLFLEVEHLLGGIDFVENHQLTDRFVYQQRVNRAFRYIDQMKKEVDSIADKNKLSR